MDNKPGITIRSPLDEHENLTLGQWVIKKIVTTIFSVKIWAFILTISLVICNVKLDWGINDTNISYIVYLAIGLFTGDGLSRIGNGLSSLRR